MRIGRIGAESNNRQKGKFTFRSFLQHVPNQNGRYLPFCNPFPYTRERREQCVLSNYRGLSHKRKFTLILLHAQRRNHLFTTNISCRRSCCFKESKLQDAHTSRFNANGLPIYFCLIACSLVSYRPRFERFIVRMQT